MEKERPVLFSVTEYSAVKRRKAYAVRYLLAAVAVFSAGISAAAEPYEHSYILPDETIEAKAELFAVDKEKKYLCSRYILGCSVTAPLSLYCSFDYIDTYMGKSGLSGPGDSSASVRYYAGSPASHVIVVLSAGLTIPTGGDLYAESGWSGLSFGNYEAVCGASLRWDFRPFVLAASMQYRFRQGKDEDFASRYFMSPQRLSDDYAAAGVSFSVVPGSFLSGYVSVQPVLTAWRRPHRDTAALENGDGSCLIPVSCGVRFFFSGNAFVSLYYTEQLIKYEGYLSRGAGAAVSLLF